MCSGKGKGEAGKGLGRRGCLWEPQPDSPEQGRAAWGRRGERLLPGCNSSLWERGPQEKLVTSAQGGKKEFMGKQ